MKGLRASGVVSRVCRERECAFERVGLLHG